MCKSNLNSRGLTVIELLFVVVVICVLGSLVAVSYNGIQFKNRDTERRKDIDAIKLQLETYYTNTNMYPTQSSMNDPTWRKQNMKNLAEDSLQDPKWKKSNSSCTLNDQPTLAAEPANNCYSYQVTDASGSPCDNNVASCVHYVLTAKLESGENYIKTSLN